MDHLSNSLATSSQLQALHDNDSPESQATRFAQCHLTQAAGMLLRLPQEVIATAIVLLQQYQLISSQVETKPFSKSESRKRHPPRIISAAILYVTAKLSFTPLSPRSIINVYTYLTTPTSSPLWYINVQQPATEDQQKPNPRTYYVSEGTYANERIRLFSAETHILTQLGFNTQVCLPHTLALTYLQILIPTSHPSSPTLAARVIAHLNTALLGPQFLYLTHQPNALAVAAIYLAARDVGVKLVRRNWWDVFDVEREDLGFLVLALASTERFVEREREKCLEAGKGIELG